MITTTELQQRAARIEREAHADGILLPIPAATIAVLEAFGLVVDLDTGAPVDCADRIVDATLDGQLAAILGLGGAPC